MQLGRARSEYSQHGQGCIQCHVGSAVEWWAAAGQWADVGIFQRGGRPPSCQSALRGPQPACGGASQALPAKGQLLTVGCAKMPLTRTCSFFCKEANGQDAPHIYMQLFRQAPWTARLCALCPSEDAQDLISWWQASAAYPVLGKDGVPKVSCCCRGPPCRQWSWAMPAWQAQWRAHSWRRTCT